MNFRDEIIKLNNYLGSINDLLIQNKIEVILFYELENLIIEFKCEEIVTDISQDEQTLIFDDNFKNFIKLKINEIIGKNNWKRIRKNYKLKEC